MGQNEGSAQRPNHTPTTILYVTVPWARELQQYAEEVVYLAKKNTVHHNGLVESMLTSAPARQILYEKMVPRYKDRPFYFTRVVNKWELRERDAAKLGFLEFIDRPGEYRPANPVGAERRSFVRETMEHGTRRERRKLVKEAKIYRILDKEGILVPKRPAFEGAYDGPPPDMLGNEAHSSHGIDGAGQETGRASV